MASRAAKSSIDAIAASKHDKHDTMGGEIKGPSVTTERARLQLIPNSTI